MKTVLELISLSTDFLRNKGIPYPRKSSEELIADALGLSRVDLYLNYDRPIQEEELKKVREALKRSIQGEPWQYIRGFVEFYGCHIKVSQAVLIPRPETEILVDLVVKEIALKDLSQKKLLDLCAGSGCIGLALKKRFPELQVTLSEISEQAYQLILENSDINDLEVHVIKGDFFKPFENKKFDFIVCNPPYISEKEYEMLDKSVKDFEPKGALCSGPTGLEFYERLAREVGTYLNPGGKLFLEIGYTQGPALKEIFTSPHFKNLNLRKDWAGHDRFFSLENE